MGSLGYMLGEPGFVLLHIPGIILVARVEVLQHLRISWSDRFFGIMPSTQIPGSEQPPVWYSENGH